MVIRALYDYEAQSNQELSFSKGDFFHVIGRENDEDWYEACNPAVPDARGLVPAKFFQRLGKTERDSGQSSTSTASTKAPDHDSGYSDTSSPTPHKVESAQRMSKTMRGTGAMVYGVVMFDFAAERPDELDAKEGEAIIVIAQSNPEWFVAKPIGRLGGPGLIPVSFIEIRDMGTGKPVADAHDAVQRAGVPKVEEWKKMAANYKNSSITLGKFESANTQSQNLQQGMDRLSLNQGPRQAPGSSQPLTKAQQHEREAAITAELKDPSREEQRERSRQFPLRLQMQNYTKLYPFPSNACSRAQLPEFRTVEGGEACYIIKATLEDGSSWELWRIYDNFWKLQMMLKDQFPVEAGYPDGKNRTLPYMPGPLTEGQVVTEEISAGRRYNLDQYVKNLLEMPEYISRSILVTSFFSEQNQYDRCIEPPRGSGGYGKESDIGTPMDEGSRQSSRGELAGNGYGGLSAAPTPQGYPHVQQNGQASASPYQIDTLRQTSSQPSNGSAQDLTATQQPSAMKVKIYYGDDLFAIRVPTNIHFQQLHEKIRDRLKIPQGDDVALFYKDEASGDKPGLLSNNDLDLALRRNDKLIIYVEPN
ncbi:MAG: bud emergence protein 1 [Claussenomyces sp. TS43310]|nr:MAG: bud emergence protein 1 [Claussenomyces sp. TS43310]